MMDWLGRLLRVAIALVVAVIMGSLALLFLLPLASDALEGGFRHFIFAMGQTDDPAALIQATFEGLGRFLVLIAVAPVVFTGLVGEVAGWRSALWYIAGTALLTAATPLIMRAGWVTPTPEEARVSAYLGIAGLISGTIYWLIAGSRVAVKTKDEGARS